MKTNKNDAPSFYRNSYWSLIVVFENVQADFNIILFLVILTFRSEATREPFSAGPRNFELWSDDGDDTRVGIPLQTSVSHQQEDVLSLCMMQLETDPIHDGSAIESGFET
ncbi:hypothetical protein AVEN_176476-1 [Araneus ventricosus]|uniref:Uncharacterized protein n=1 Tax=Araneus ventricosus TaxID=182803 RepID=A0A4Y2TVY2_ARAVE|nr:hypothetical protein AVEN_176476-1 [Araneus ventricosus]